MSSVNTGFSLPTISIGSDGHVTAGNLVGGLDTDSIIKALMTAAAIPQTQLKSKLSTEQDALTQYQNLNQSLQALATSAADDAAVNGLNLLGVTSSDPSVTATASTSANATQLTMQVDSVAQAQVSVSAPMTAWPDTTGAITIVGSDGVSHEVTAASGSVQSAVAAINSAGLGVTAAAVSIGTDAGGAEQYRIQFTSTHTGSDSAFQLYAGTASDVAAGTATDMLTQAGAATISAAQDAQVTLWPGTAAAQTITSHSNTFTDIQEGMTVTVSQPTAGTVTLSAALDADSVQKAASTLVGAVNTLTAFITKNSAGSNSKDEAGNTTVDPGVFGGDFAIRQLGTRLTRAVSDPVGGGDVSPSSIGISIQQDGSIQFDATAFQSALASDQAGTIAAVQEIASRVQSVAELASDPQNGSVTNSINTKQTQIGTDQKAIANWDTVLSGKKKVLEMRYSNLVTVLGQLQAQQQYLQQQIDMMTRPSS